MTIDWNHFTPWTALAGGILLGLASAAFVLVNGRILGISGIVGGLLRPQRRRRRLAHGVCAGHAGGPRAVLAGCGASASHASMQAGAWWC